MIYVWLFFLHFVADFLLQSREMGQKKSTVLRFWRLHVIIVYFVFFLGLLIFVPTTTAFLFAVCNAVIHGLIDGFIWKGYAWTVWERKKREGWNKDALKAKWKYWEDSWFYTTIGLDQFLHISTIVLLWGLF